MSMNIVRGKGILIDMRDYVQLRASIGGSSFWEPDYQHLLIRKLAPFLPRMEYDREKQTVLVSMVIDGVEQMSRSRGIGTPPLLPKKELNKLKECLAALRAEVESVDADPSIKKIIQAFQIPDPSTAPEMYRIYGKNQLAIIWGMERMGSNSISVVDKEIEEKLPLPKPENSIWGKTMWGLLAVLVLGGLCCLAYPYMTKPSQPIVDEDPWDAVRRAREAADRANAFAEEAEALASKSGDTQHRAEAKEARQKAENAEKEVVVALRNAAKADTSRAVAKVKEAADKAKKKLDEVKRAADEGNPEAAQTAAKEARREADLARNIAEGISKKAEKSGKPADDAAAQKAERESKSAQDAAVAAEQYVKLPAGGNPTEGEESQPEGNPTCNINKVVSPPPALPVNTAGDTEGHGDSEFAIIQGFSEAARANANEARVAAENGDKNAADEAAEQAAANARSAANQAKGAEKKAKESGKPEDADAAKKATVEAGRAQEAADHAEQSAAMTDPAAAAGKATKRADAAEDAADKAQKAAENGDKEAADKAAEQAAANARSAANQAKGAKKKAKESGKSEDLAAAQKATEEADRAKQAADKAKAVALRTVTIEDSVGFRPKVVSHLTNEDGSEHVVIKIDTKRLSQATVQDKPVDMSTGKVEIDIPAGGEYVSYSITTEGNPTPTSGSVLIKVK